MLSRRSVRVKVMQLLYMLNRDEQVTFPEMVKHYNDDTWKTFELYIFHLAYLVKLAEYTVEVGVKKAAKLLPSDEDKQYVPKLYENELVKSLANNVAFRKLIEKYDIHNKYDVDSVRHLYQAFEQTAPYKAFQEEPITTNESVQKILLELYRFLTANEHFQEITDDAYNNWSDDESLVVGAVKRTLKALPATEHFYKDFEPTDDTVREFGESLLQNVGKHDAALMEQIEPALKNWDADRVAVLDMIMIKMGLCELMFFPTIPTKVTLNEYVEISKMYSTDKSKEFVNGLLDKIMKKLIKEEKIVKEGRGLDQ